MDYVIFFQDDAEYQMAVAIAGGNLLKMAPHDAATLFGIPFPYPGGNMDLIPRGIYFLFPYTVGTELRFPGASGVFVDDTILTVTVPGQNASPNITGFPGPDGIFTWSGNIVKNRGAATSGEPIPTAIPQRRFIGGRELFERIGQTAIDGTTKDSSRTIDGHGQSIRGNINNTLWNKGTNEYRIGLNPRTSWERYYVRFRRRPSTNDVGFWRCHGAPSNGCGVGFKFATSGLVIAVDMDPGSTETPIGTVWNPLLNVWYRVDNLIRFGSGSPPGIINTYINGLLSFSFTSSGSGIGGASSHNNSDFGKWTGPIDPEVEIDLDDWMNADIPANCSSTTLAFIDNNFPIDWLVGSHMRLHYVLSATQVNWTPAGEAVGALNQYPVPLTRRGTSVVTSVTSGATLEGLTDAVPQNVFDSLANIIGAVAGIVTMVSNNAGGTDGQLGYRLAGGGAILATVDEGLADGTNIVAYLPSGMILPTEIAPFSVVHTKSLDANANPVAMLLAEVEYIGVWGPEDDPSFQYPITRISNLHNCRYNNSGWGYLGSQPQAPTYSIGATYVGNGTYQEITLPAACHMLWIRPAAGGAQGVYFFGAAYNAHLGTTETVIPNVRMWFDFANNLFKFSVTGGATSEVNVNGTSYQYIAFCDPGMRFCNASAYVHGVNTSTPKANPLIAADFLANLGFFQRETPVTSGLAGLWVRGQVHTANNGYDITNGTTDANVANFSIGNVNTFSSLHGTGYNFLLFRTADSGPDGCSSNVVVQILSYVGNGAGSRNIPLTPASGRVPLLTVVFPTTGSSSAFMRDPSHVGTNSSQMGGGAISNTGITAVAIDQITVDVSINANGITYQIFTICGGLTNVNGTFFSTFCDGDGPYIDPSVDTTGVNVIGNGGLILGGEVAFTIIKDASGIYTLVAGKTHDTLINRNTAPSTTLNIKIPDPTWKTGYLGG
jgi:hypothetical protein